MPKPQRMFFVSDKKAALAGFLRARSDRGARRGKRTLFLKPSATGAGRSVASIIATVGRVGSKRSSRGASSAALIGRRVRTSSRRRNSCSMRTSGTTRWLGRRANFRQARFSGSNFTNRLNEWTGVNRLSSRTRNSWAEEKSQGRPRRREGGSASSMIESSR